MCFALPRYTNETKDMVKLDGVICLGQETSKVCFWDNQMNGKAFPFPTGTVIPIGVPNLRINPDGLYQGGGFELNGDVGGICTDCHAGQNPFIIHPNVNLAALGEPPVLMGNLNPPPHSLTFSVTRYDPLVPAAWPQNNLSMAPPYVPAVCSGCHVAGGSAGAFPHLSPEIKKGYCDIILPQAIANTMPPDNPGGEASNPAVIAFQNWCGVPASSGPSDRGDPHLTTTNGINYDFQAGGEFTALRNSATGFELQTRQTPISTTFTPGANPYTGLASCVSLNTAVAVRVGKHRISYQPSGVTLIGADRLELRIDGELVTLPPGGIDLGSGNRISNADSNGALTINLADGTVVIIVPSFWASEGYWYMDVEIVNTPAREGTMGHIMGANWLPFAPNGTSFGPAPASIANRHVLLNQKFADAWRVTNATSLFDYAPGFSTANFTNLEWPPRPGAACRVSGSTRPPVEPMKPDLAKNLCRDIKDKIAFENCVFDLIVTGDVGRANAYLRSLKLRATLGVWTDVAVTGSTPWLNRDQPGGVGDYETTTDHLKIACRFKATGKAITDGAPVGYRCNPREGGWCKNNDPAGLKCDDMEVMFSWIGVPAGATRWLNRDQPSGVGDYETTTDHLKIKCRFKATGIAITDGAPVGYRCNVPEGGWCKNNDPAGLKCQDMEVMFSW
jgi:hypothetical protein